MANVNILEGVRCPQCKSDGPFKIEATSLFTIYDDGAGDHEDVTWQDDSPCQCDNCDHSGTVKDYTLEEKEATP
jgi:hypothetical protein